VAAEAAEEEPEESEKEEAAEFEVKKFLEDIKETAKHVDLNNRYIYEPTSGLYYDPTTGYYYNSEYNLFYDGATGTYYSYNEQTFEYEFHSQVATAVTEKEPKEVRKKVLYAVTPGHCHSF
jgi:hypothetical protein